MTEWTLLKRLLDAVHQHSTMIGRLWLTVMVIFRLLVVAVATEDVYADEQEMFVCNTLQPGCSTVCYDAFAPISQPRFWVFHIISVSTPSLCFIVYTWHNLSKSPHAALGRRRGVKEGGQVGGGQEGGPPSCSSDSCSVLSHQHLGHSLADILEGGGLVTSRHVPAGSSEGLAVSGGVLSKCYIFHVCLRAALEVGFVLAQWKLFGLQVPVRFVCSSSPCNQPVDCYVSRPTEKTIFLIFMFCVGLFCIFLNLLELNHLGWKKIRQAVQLKEEPSWPGCTGGRQGYEALPPVSPSPKSSLGLKDISSTPLPTLDVVMAHRPEWSCVLNCGKKREFQKVQEIRLEVSKRADPHRGQRPPVKNAETRGSKQSCTEVWI
ncbi:gap junction delta-2 protein-like [Takifugu rubripes]|uniref:gap junction delta-2 protein-like n=1 Tax=Takifugu rubripes TaxID=31033 RepID=UPI001145E852|nr:gap junction delta-2 protein-like [Takifugu rubripes]XP_029688125.1 gap junction delta-2 protein-like [Takifugu rubripes]